MKGGVGLAGSETREYCDSWLTSLDIGADVYPLGIAGDPSYLKGVCSFGLLDAETLRLGLELEGNLLVMVMFSSTGNGRCPAGLKPEYRKVFASFIKFEPEEFTSPLLFGVSRLYELARGEIEIFPARPRNASLVNS